MNIATPMSAPPAIKRPVADGPIFMATGRATISIRAGTAIGEFDFPAETLIALPDTVAGSDYAIRLKDGQPVAQACADAIPTDAIGGFHFAPGGNATARSGGDDIPAINPLSIWDAGFRPACPDPRGMSMIVLPDGSRSWIDIYKLGVDHLKHGTSRFGVTIADGESLPARIDGSGKVARLDFATAQEILAYHGKQLLTYDEFRGAAFGVTEKTAAGKDPKTTGLDAPRTSACGMMQATGNLWDWGTDGDPDNPRASIFGGDWRNGDYAGARYAFLDYWPALSDWGVSARGRCDHLMPA